MDSLPFDRRADIVVSGAGHVGLVFALALAHELGPDLSVLVVDRAIRSTGTTRSDVDDPRASAISAGGRNLLERIGVWPLLAAHAVPVRQIELTDSSLKSGVRRPLLSYDNCVDDAAPASWIVPNSVLSAASEQAAADCPSLERLNGVEVTGFESAVTNAIVTLRDGRRIATDLVVAADGRHSALREAAGIGAVTWNHDQIGIVTTIGHELDHQGRAVQHFLPGGPFAMLPLEGGFRSCVTWSETADEAKRILALDDAGFLDELDLRAGGRFGAVRLAGARRSWPLDAHLARSYIAPRLALIGDAAHSVHPIGGQGLNLGYRDVAALVECIADAAKVGLDLADTGALDRYQRWRRFDSAMSSAAFSGLNRLFSNDVALLRSAREVGLGILDRLPAVKQLLVQEAAGFSGDLPRLLRNPSAV